MGRSEGAKILSDEDAEDPDQPLDLPHVGRLDPTRDEIDGPGLLAGLNGEVIGHAPNHIREAGNVRADITGRVRMNHVLSGRDLSHK